MGKKKQSQRTKNNAVPASSGRSAELLQSSSGVPFVGFSTLKEGGFIPILSGLSDDLDVTINEDFRLVWKKMNKKDTTTKLKALDEFKKLCQDCDVEVLKPVLPFWPRVYSTLSTDEEHRVREAAHTAHRAVITKAGRNIAPYLKQLVGPWFTGQHDSYAPAASAAQAAFQEAFPPNKLIEAIIFCQEEILSYISSNLLNQTPQTLANTRNGNQEVKDARYERVIVSCLNGYALYLMRLPTEHLHKAEEANRKLVSSAKFWKFNKDSAPIVRAAWFTALVALCEKAGFLLKDEAKHVCMAVFTNLEETDPSVVRSLWQAVLLSFTVVDDVWKHVSLEKLVLPKLWKVLKEGCDGSASLVFPNLLPLISKIPTTLLTDKTKFYSKFFSNLQEGLKVRNVLMSATESSAVVKTFFECLRYLISINSEDHELCLSLVENQMFLLVEAVLSEPKLHLARPCLFPSLVGQVNQWSSECQPHLTSLSHSFWNWLAITCRALMEAHLSDPATLTTNCSAVQAMLKTFRNPDSTSRKRLKVKFESETKSSDAEDDDLSPIRETPLSELSASFVKERSQFVDGQLQQCFSLLVDCGLQARAVLVAHLASVIQLYHSPQVFSQVVNAGGGTWTDLYQKWLSQWMIDDTISLHLSLELIFTLLEYVEEDSHVLFVFADLNKKKWQEVVEWALKSQKQSAAVCRWLQSCGGVCRLASLLTRDHPSYNTLHNSLRNLRHNNWLTTAILDELVTSLRYNLRDPDNMLVDEKPCSGDLLQAMLQNTANHIVLAQLPADKLQILLYELLTASLQHLPNYPSGWHHCITVLALQPSPDLTSVYNTCVDLLVAVARTRIMNLAESQQLVCVLEKLIVTMARGEEDNLVEVGMGVLSRLVARTAEHAPALWHLLSVAELLSGAQRDTSLPTRQLRSHKRDDPLSSEPLEQYITTMIPFLMIVVRLQTNSQEGEDQLFYTQLRSGLPPEDLWDWTVQVLQLHCVAHSVQEYFVISKQYFMLKEKIDYILEECGLLSQLKLKEVISHLDLSIFEEGSNSLLKNDPLARLQTQVVLRNLSLLYDIHQIRKELLPFKSTNPIIKYNYFPNEVLEEVAATTGHLDRCQLATINTCCRRLVVLEPDSHPHISILDRVFDQFVAEQKEHRSLLNFSPQELHHIAEVVDFACYSVSRNCIHLQQSSWDACMVATAALSLSVASTLADIAQPEDPDFRLQETPPTQPWPLSLLTDNPPSFEDDSIEKSLSLPVVRMVCSVCRLFDAVSAHMESVDPEDKAAVTRSVEWRDVFLSGTHAALSKAWIVVANMPCIWPDQFLVTATLSSSVSKFVQYPHFVLDQNTLSSLETCCQLLQSAQSAVQLTAHKLLLKLIPAMIELDMKQCEKDTVALSCQYVEQTLENTESILDIILSNLSFGDMCIVKPFTDSYRFTRCYLLLWNALLELCGQAGSQLRALYTTWLKEDNLPVFMKTVFCLMPEAALHGDLRSPRTSQKFSNPFQFDKGMWDSERLSELSCWMFACSLRRLPAAIRQWWNETDHRIHVLVEHVTATYVSPELCAEEMRSIQTHEMNLENMTVQVHPTTKEVYAVYTLEESQMELAIELAHNHPLGQVKVRSGQRMVSTTQTRQWLLQITILLTHQNGSIWDALELWKHSLDKRFEGVEECYICFAILHSTSHQMPKLSCQTCRKKFHTHCLFKWFTTSHKSTCPICRNMF